jgi:UvrB/uvrC motif
MAKAARDLQFERAALLRDQLIGLRQAMTDSREATATGQLVGAAPARPGRPGRFRRGRPGR